MSSNSISVIPAHCRRRLPNKISDDNKGNCRLSTSKNLSGVFFRSCPLLRIESNKLLFRSLFFFRWCISCIHLLLRGEVSTRKKNTGWSDRLLVRDPQSWRRPAALPLRAVEELENLSEGKSFFLSFFLHSFRIGYLFIWFDPLFGVGSSSSLVVGLHVCSWHGYRDVYKQMVGFLILPAEPGQKWMREKGEVFLLKGSYRRTISRVIAQFLFGDGTSRRPTLKKPATDPIVCCVVDWLAQLNIRV